MSPRKGEGNPRNISKNMTVDRLVGIEGSKLVDKSQAPWEGNKPKVRGNQTILQPRGRVGELAP